MEIKKCPFCGNDFASLVCIDQIQIYYVGCPSCSMQGPKQRRPSLAIEAWNRLYHIPDFTPDVPKETGFYYHCTTKYPEELCIQRYMPSHLEVLRNVTGRERWAGPLPIPPFNFTKE